MANLTSEPPPGQALLIGASRGLGYAMAAEFVGRGWGVLGTVRTASAPRERLKADHPCAVDIETLDLTDHDQIRAVRGRLAGRRFDIVFINGGVANRSPSDTFAEVADEEFAHVMTTNVLGVMRAVEAFGDLVRPGGVVGVMSSGQGSIANNTNGTNDIYRASKAALNQAMSSYGARQRNRDCAVVLMAPGWIRTDMGGANAPFGVEDAMPQVVDGLIEQMDHAGLRFVDRHGQSVPW